MTNGYVNGYVTIRNGAYRCDLYPDRIHEWTLAAWRGAMKQMAKGGEINLPAAEALAKYFPEAGRTFTEELQEKRLAFEHLYVDPKTLPRGLRGAQSDINARLRREVKQAQNKLDRLAARHHEFVAAKAAMKKE